MASGKWNDPEIPKRNWVLLEILDYEKPGPICDMCEVMQIRYQYVMRHRDYRGLLCVGCICAGYMMESRERAEEELRSFKKVLAKKQRLMESPRWRTSRNENEMITYNGARLVIFPYRSGFKWVYGGEFSDSVYPTHFEAKDAGCDAAVGLLSS